MGGTTSEVPTREFSSGVAHKICVAAGRVGITPQQLNDLAESAEGMQNFRRFLDGGYQLQVVVARGSFPVWRTFRTGGKTREQLLAGLQAVGNQVSDWGQQMMAHQAFVTAPKAKEAAFVRVRVMDLGFTDSQNLPTTAQIWERADALGLDRCLPDDGPNLRLAYQDQPVGEVIYIAMDQIADAGGNPNVFRLERYDDGLWLLGNYAPPDFQWRLGSVLVFRKRP